MVGPAWFEAIVDAARERAAVKVAAVRAAHPRDDETALGRRLIRSAALRAGLFGAATGTLSLIALPLGLPAGIAATLLVEAELLFGLMELFRIDAEGEGGRVRLYALWAGGGFADAAKNAGLRAGAGALGRLLRDSLPGRIIRRLNPELIRAILKRIGLGWLPRAAKLWPILGAPVSFVFDRAAVEALGEAALRTLRTEAVSAAPRRRVKVRRAARGQA